MMLSDAVTIALITGVTTTVSTVATLVVTLITKRGVKHLDRTVRDQHSETRVSLAAAMCRHPADLPFRSTGPEVKR